MKITNNNNLPHEMYEALAHSNYDAGSSDYSVTTLLNPPRIVQLERRHWQDLSCDAMDRLWSVFGEIAHSIFERHTHEDAKAEERLYYNALGRRIGGKFDNYRDGVISDFKITSAWTLVYGSRFKEWEEQLNLYAFLLHQHGIPVTKIRINCILRDWDKNKAKQGGGYPDAPIQIIPITLWDYAVTEEFLLERLQEHIDAEDKKDDFLPICTAEERWEQPSKYAVMKEGAKRAIKLFDDKEEAQDFIDKAKEVYYIILRQGKRTRCEEYCDVNSKCNIYQEYLKGLAVEQE